MIAQCKANPEGVAAALGKDKKNAPSKRVLEFAFELYIFSIAYHFV
jgi:hypothetical protein